jgi:hypothetical protein
MLAKLVSYAERYGSTLTLHPIDALNPGFGYYASLENRPGMWGSIDGKITRAGATLQSAIDALYEAALARHCA